LSLFRGYKEKILESKKIVEISKYRHKISGGEKTASCQKFQHYYNLPFCFGGLK
jgi:hypothetical protein